MKSLFALLFGGMKFSKLFTSGGSRLLSLVASAVTWGWRFAAGFIVLLLIHEMGHYIAARQRGLPVGLPTFIPFIGAWVEMKEQPVDAETEAYVAFAGPFVGTIASFVVYLLSRHYGSDMLLAIAYSGLFLNLFNLLPVSPLDGGRITAVVSPRIWLIGAPFLVAMTFYSPSPALIIVALVAIPQLIRAWKFDPTDPENARYYCASAAVRIEYAMLYIGLAALLGVMTYDVHEMLASARAR